MLDGLQAAGEAAELVHYTLAGDILALKRVKDALAAGRPMPLALRENRVWGARERLFERILPLLGERALAELVESASICDGLVKGLKHPHWPDDPWAGLQRLALMVCERVGVASGAGRAGTSPRRLALVG
jgi:DNA polymerase-3 subunit delta